MNKVRISILMLIAIMISGVFLGCAGDEHLKSLTVSSAYPNDLLPIYTDAIVYAYENEGEENDVLMGTVDSMDDAIKYYQQLLDGSKYLINYEDQDANSYTVTGQVDIYSFFIRIREPLTRPETSEFNTIVEISTVITKISTTPAPTIEPSKTPIKTIEITPTLSPEPTPDKEIIDGSDMDIAATYDLRQANVFIECYGVTDSDYKDINLLDGNKYIDVTLKIINYGNQTLGAFDGSVFTLVTDDRIVCESQLKEGFFASSIEILGGGFVKERLRYQIPEDSKAYSLSCSGIGRYLNASFTMELFPEEVPTDGGKYFAGGPYIINMIESPVFTLGQKYVIDNLYSVTLINAEFFIAEDSFGEKKMYTFEINIENFSDEDIIFSNIFEFYLYDAYHNVLSQPTVLETPYEELSFRSVASKKSLTVNISFELFEETQGSQLKLLMSKISNNDNDVLFIIN